MSHTLAHAHLHFSATETSAFRLTESPSHSNVVVSIFEELFDTTIVSTTMRTLDTDREVVIKRRPTEAEWATHGTARLTGRNGETLRTSVFLAANVPPELNHRLFDFAFRVWNLMPSSVAIDSVDSVTFNVVDETGSAIDFGRDTPGNPDRGLTIWGGFKRDMSHVAFSRPTAADFFCARPTTLPLGENEHGRTLERMRLGLRDATDYPPWVRRREENGLIGFQWANTTDVRQLHEVFTVKRNWIANKIGPSGLTGGFKSNGDEIIGTRGSRSDTPELDSYHEGFKVGWLDAEVLASHPVSPRQFEQVTGWLHAGRTSSGKEIRVVGFMFPTREQAIAAKPLCDEIGARAVYRHPKYTHLVYDPFPDMEFIPDDWRPDPQILGWEQTDDGWARVPGVRSPVE